MSRIGYLIALALALAPVTAMGAAGTHSNSVWSYLPDGNGGICDKFRPGTTCYFHVFDATPTVPALPDADDCGQIFLWQAGAAGSFNFDYKACDHLGGNCADFTGFTGVSATGHGPQGGTAAAIGFDVNTCSGTCDFVVGAACGVGG